MNWIECDNCLETFAVIVEELNVVKFCPLCGSEVTAPDEDEDLDDYD